MLTKHELSVFSLMVAINGPKLVSCVYINVIKLTAGNAHQKVNVSEKTGIFTQNILVPKIIKLEKDIMVLNIVN